MPTRELMCWVPSQRLWTKRYMGKRYYISARQLGIRPLTKEASLLAANQWWRDKQAELDLAEKLNRQQPRQPGPHENLASAMIGGETGDLLASLQGIMSEHFADPPPVREEMVKHLSEVLAGLLFDRMTSTGRIPDVVREKLPPARTAQLERGIKELHGESAAEPDRTVRELSEKWLHTQKVQVDIGGISAGRYDNLRHALSHFTTFLGDTADASTINAETLEGFHNHCLSKIAERREDGNAGLSAIRAKQVFAVAKQWIGWLVGRGTIAVPPNLQREWRFGPTTQQVKVWPVDEVRRVVSEATGKLKLCLLLMLNTGATQKDVSDLLDTEVNWKSGRVIRKRSKTRGHDDVPVVDYRLWPATFRLLKEHRSGKERVLLTKSGKPYVNHRLVNGEFRGVDGFGTLLRGLTKKLGIKHPIKLLRKTSATLLEGHTATLPTGELVNPFAGCVSMFLGHSPKSMKDKHYAAPPQALFDAAVLWLGQQFGFVDGPEVV